MYCGDIQQFDTIDDALVQAPLSWVTSVSTSSR
jgi:hypothetical protein